MNEELETLSQVQKVDTKIIENEKKRALGPQKIEEMAREIAETKERLSREKEIIEELEKERRKKEQELETEKAQIKKAESKLYEVKTNKEYQAMLKEIETARGTNDKTEEDIILLMERIEELKKDYQSSSKALAIREKEVAEETKELEKQIETVGSVVTKLRVERERLLAGVSEDVKARYNILIEKRAGVAVVNVRNGTCLGCFMNIPPQLFIEVMKNNRLITCPSCNRILFYVEEE
ncbi:MAG: putative zinc ribbon domain protein [Syntrophorhabdaceae bacterium PtaU1.Bin034]|nr:MAG: putative zinc ribbon domain protein [Syntrophorhabdaceae bacterium PtaU1.Bin034]